MTGRLSGKVAIVTGASSGMGLATALMFAKEGAKLVLVSRTKAKLETVAKEINALGTQSVVVAGDVADEAINKEMVDTAIGTFGQLDIAFLNAGSLAQKKIVDCTEEDIDSMFGHNVKSLVFALKYVLPAMAKSPNNGSVIVTSSSMSAFPRYDFAGTSLYGASKAAADILVKYAAIEAAEDGTRVNAIAPGIIATNIMGLNSDQTDGFAATKQLISRAGRGEEIASFVTYLASDEASFITGSIHLIDGGWTLRA